MEDVWNDDPLDHCGTSEASIAFHFARIFPNRFRYIGNGRWEYVDDDGTWKKDASRKKITHAIGIQFNAMIMQRAKRWQNRAWNTIKSAEDTDATFMVKHMLNISASLQRPHFIVCVLKELAGFYSSEL